METARPRVLDLFCCEGGACAGYQRAGWNVYGVDMAGKFAKRYPGEGFYAGDALLVLCSLLAGERVEFSRDNGTTERLSLSNFDAIHASPPCQGYTRGNAGRVTSWPKLIPGIRALLAATARPFVIENVKDAGAHMLSPVGLCGCMFNLSTIDTDGVRIHLQRLRLFESGGGFRLPGGPPCDHSRHKWVAGAYGGARRDKYEAKYVRKGGYVPANKDVVKALLGIEHDMTWNGLFESVPPAFTEHIGRHLLAHINRAALAA